MESCVQLIDEKIKSGIGQDIYELTRISRQAAIINLVGFFHDLAFSRSYLLSVVIANLFYNQVG